MGENTKTTPEALYAEVQSEAHTVMDATFAVRKFGSGPPLVFVHGFPTHGYTWRKLLPSLSTRYSCYVIDLPGLGDSGWTSETDFSFTAQAARLAQLCAQLGLTKYGLIAHDTGATIARLVAAQNPAAVSHLVCFNTEIPRHRPPWISTYQLLAKLPAANPIFRLTMRSKLWLQSSMGAKEFYSDKSRLAISENVDPYIRPVVNSARRMEGLLNYLLGIEWAVVDGMQTLHRQIAANTLFLWGEDDHTFPVQLAEALPSQLNGNARLTRLHGALLPHEESPDAVLAELARFLPR